MQWLYVILFMLAYLTFCTIEKGTIVIINSKPNMVKLSSTFSLGFPEWISNLLFILSTVLIPLHVA